MGQYEIKPGDHLFQIADREGFRNADTIWLDGGNDELRDLRANPGVLAPGDALFIPDRQQKRLPAAIDQRHVFVAKTDKLKLRLRLLDFDSKPIVGIDTLLFIEGRRYEQVTNGDGVVERKVPRNARSGRFKVEKLDIDLPLSIGELDPVDLETGWRARLINLGYYRGAIDDADDGADKRWQWAIEEFQCDQKLKVTGELDAETRAKLESAHGS